MKAIDFIKLIDLKEEFKEYKRFEAGKSKKYRSYQEWDDHIQSILYTIESPIDMHNLKRHCLDVVRAGDDVSKIFWGYVGLSFPLLLAISTFDESVILKTLILFALLFYIIAAARYVSRKKNFYQDMLTAIKQIESKSSISSRQTQRRRTIPAFHEKQITFISYNYK